MPLLWVRDSASGELRSLPGTEDGTMPFWSPDSRDLGFFAGNTLKRVSARADRFALIADNVGPCGPVTAARGRPMERSRSAGKPGCSVCPQMAVP